MTLRHGCLALVLAVGTMFATTGCSNTSKENATLRKQNQDIANQLAAQKATNDDLQKKIDDLNMRVLAGGATQPGVDTAAPSEVLPGTPDLGAPTDEGGGVSVRTSSRGETEIEIVGDVLFAPGKAALKPASMKSLEKAVAMLKSKYTGHRLRIEGHTDPTPVGKSGWDDNYDLGAARARAVLLYLKAHGVPEKSMYIASFGANDLRSTKNLALDRRVDIVVEK